MSGHLRTKFDLFADAEEMPVTRPLSVAVEGNKVRLRPLQRDDHKISLAWRNDPEIRDGILGYRFPITEVMEEEWVDNVLNDQSRTRVVVAIEEKVDQALIGFVYLNGIDWINRHGEFGILIGDGDKHRKGFGREACSLMVDYAFNVLNLHKIVLRVASYNQPAIDLYRAFGFVQEGVQREQIALGGRFHDLIFMGLLRREFKAHVSPSTSST
jgi:diamine N-acetyltransferase